MNLFKTLFFTLFFWNLLLSIGHAQDCVPVFQKTYGGNGIDEALSILHTSDGGSIVGGRTSSSATESFDAFAMKLDRDGDINWSYNYSLGADEEIVKIVASNDGGYLAMGNVTAANGDRTPFLLKLDASGGLLWSSGYPLAGANQLVAADIIQLTNGDYAMLANQNPGSSLGNGLLLKISATGTLQYSKLFDNGNDDYLKAICQQGDSLIIIGHAKIGGYRQAIITKLSLQTGTVFESKSIWRFSENRSQRFHTGAVNIQQTSNGIAFTTSHHESDSMYMFLTNFRMLSSGEIIYERKVPVVAGSLFAVEKINSLVTNDSAFIVSYFDSSSKAGNPEFVIFDFTGHIKTRRMMYGQWQPTKMPGMDVDSSGYWFAGYYRPDYWSAANSHIKVIRTNINGTWGSCTGSEANLVPDSVHHLFQNFTWANIHTGSMAGNSLNSIRKPSQFTITINCKDTYCETPEPLTDSCRTAYHVRLKSRARIRVFEAVQLPDGGTLMAGGNELKNSFQAVVTKFRKNGLTDWSFNYGQYQDNSFCKGILPQPDGSFIIYGIEQRILNHGVDDHSFVIKLDNKGNMIWNRELESVSIYKAIATADGGLIAVVNGRWGSGYIYNYIVRLSNTGAILWKKELFHNGAVPVYKALVLDGNDLYVAADRYLYGNAIKLQRFNAVTGDFIWDKDIYNTGSSDLTFMLQNVFIVRDTVFVVTRNSLRTGTFTYKVTLAVVPFDKNGRLLESFEIAGGNFKEATDYWRFNEHQFQRVDKTVDDNIVTAQLSEVNGLQVLEVIKFSPQGTLIWNRRYAGIGNYQVMHVRADSSSILISGLIPHFNEYTDESAFLLKLDNNGRISDTATANCKPADGSITKSLITGFADVVPVRLERVEDEKWLSPKNYTAMRLPLYTAASTTICKSPSLCNQLQVKGPGSICAAATEQIYVAVKNQQCTAKPFWSFDTAFAEQTALTDTSITLMFKKKGTTIVKTNILDGCGVLEASIEVIVQNNDLSPDLGSDTTLCPGKSIRLAPKDKYVSYLWQDGKTDSFYIATQPGMYILKTTSACGTQLTDTILIKNAGSLTLSAGADTSLCAGDSIQLNATSGLAGYTWTPNFHIIGTTTANPTVFPLTDTRYTVTAVSAAGCQVSDSLLVQLKQAVPVQLAGDTSICNGDSIILHAGTGLAGYAWNDGSVTESITVKTAGAYTVQVTDHQGCGSSATFSLTAVFSNPAPQLDKKISICQGTAVILDGGSNMISYVWNNLAASRYFTATQTGSYALQVTDANGCIAFDTAVITQLLDLPANFLPADTGICNYGSFKINPLSAFSDYRWNTGEISSVIETKTPGLYWLEVTNNQGCIGRDSIVLTPVTCNTGVYIPTAFSPNADGKNDLFKPVVFGNIVSYRFMVFNRFGELIFSTTEPGKGWDGRYKGIDQPMEAYVWKCSYQLTGNDRKEEKGTVILVR